MQSYDWLLFDADGTLFDYDRAEASALGKSFAEAGVSFSTEMLAAYRAINRDLWQELERGLIKPGVLKMRRFELLLNSLGLALPAEEFSHRYLEHLAHASDLMEGAEELITACAPKFKLALLTNGLGHVQRTRLAHSPIGKHFPVLVISEEIGAAKPAAGFFAHAFQLMGGPAPESTLMIGDNWNSDITGAVKFGAHACWFNPAGLPRPADPRIQFEITRLQELNKLLQIP
jgi:YjjG family noncanonical pyrimidine nucleotidase